MKKRNEGGFALLIVFMLAGAVALMLYQQIPRVAFESQRDKEETLIARGEQYKRAIQLYYIAYKKWPTKVEDLEDTNHKRYLRRRYIDPMTGKDEWRLIHVNGAGLLTDSLVQKPPTTPDGKTPDGKPDPSQATGGAGTGTNAPPEVNTAVLQRPSDRPLTGPGMPGSSTSSTDPNNPNNPNYYPPITLLPTTGQGPGAPGFNPQFPQMPGQAPGQQIPGQPGAPFPGGMPTGFQPGMPGQGISGTNPVLRPGQFRSQNPGLAGPVGPDGGSQPAYPQQLAPGDPSGGSGVPGAAVGMINNMLRTPRQSPDASSSAFNNNPVMGGLAGVASTFKGPSIKVYQERGKYQEWEFVLDLKKANPGQQQPGMPAAPQNPLQQGSQSGANNGSGFTIGNSTSGSATPTRPPQ